MRSHNVPVAPSILPLVLIVVVVVGLPLGFFTTSLYSERAPEFPKFPDDDVAYGTWVVFRNSRYSVWDVRHKQTNQVQFMVVSSNSNELVNDKETLARIYSVRLALHTAELVNAINNANEGIDTVEKALSEVGSLGQLFREPRFANEILSIRADLAQNTKLLSELSVSLLASKNAAQELTKTHSDHSAGNFLNSLIIGAAISKSKTATAAVVLMVKVSETARTGGWIDDFLSRIETSPPLDALTMTFGQLQASITIGKLRNRGV